MTRLQAGGRHEAKLEGEGVGVTLGLIPTMVRRHGARGCDTRIGQMSSDREPQPKML